MRGVWFVLKIHIVRKGDTLWEIAKQYGVDFEELKKSNPQLSSPDMIMPGMKIKVPSGTKSVKKETSKVKESKAPVVKETPKQTPVIKEDDHKKPKEVKVEMPKKYTPEMPAKLQTPKKEVPISKESHQAPVKPKKELPKVPMKEMIQMPVIEEELPKELPKALKTKKPKKEEKVTHQMPVAPIYHHYYHHCCPPLYHNCFPVMGEIAGGFMPHHHMQQGHMVLPMSQHAQQMMHPQDCGCHAVAPQMQQYQMREPMPFPEMNFAPFGYQTYVDGPQFQSAPKESPRLIEKPFPMPPAYPAFSESNTRRDNQEQQTNEEK